MPWQDVHIAAIVSSSQQTITRQIQVKHKTTCIKYRNVSDAFEKK